MCIIYQYSSTYTSCNTFLGLLWPSTTTAWLKATEMHVPTGLKAGSLKLRCPQGLAPSEVSRGDYPMPFSLLLVLLAILGVSWLLDTSPRSLLCLPHGCFPVCLCVSSHRQQSHWITDPPYSNIILS